MWDSRWRGRAASACLAIVGTATACGGGSARRVDAAVDAPAADASANVPDAGGTDARPGLPDGPALPPSCGAALFGDPSAPFADPVVQCRWSPKATASAQVSATPMVIDIDLDGRAEIVFLTPGPSGLNSVMHAVRGTDCAEVWAEPVGLFFNAQLAVGDVTGDGVADIVGYDEFFQIMRVFDLHGQVIAEGDRLGAFVGTGALAIADLDGQPPAEIVMSDAIFRLDLGTEWLKTVWVRNTVDIPLRSATVIADVNLNDEPDLVIGNHVYSSGLGEELTPPYLRTLAPGLAAVAQIDPASPEPEIVLVSHRFGSDGRIEVVSLASGASVFGPYVVPSRMDQGVELAFESSPVVADFDGDGKPEIGVAAVDDYRVYDPDCAGDPAPAGCVAPGVRWLSPIDAAFGSTAFDFNDDCVAEVVHADRCTLRIYDGKTGATLGSAPVGTPPWTSEPVIADVDGDGHAEIVVAAQDASSCGMPVPAGITVFRDPDRRWAFARRIWNQHTYHVTNVEEDGSIPAHEARFWDKNVGFRANVGRAP